MTEITRDQINKMTESESIGHLRKYPYSSQWKNKDALRQVEMTLLHAQGAMFSRTGKLSSFKAKTWRI